MNIQKNAFLIMEVSEAIDGWHFKSISVPMSVSESDVSADCVFDSNGDRILVETVQADSKLGDCQRLEEESFEQTLLYVPSEQCSSPSIAPFWLFPVQSVNVDSCKCNIRIAEFNLFKSAGFQLARWSRFFWGNVFFDDPTTPKEHIANATNRKLQAGDAIPVRVNGLMSGVALLEIEKAANEFESTLFVIGQVDFDNGSTLQTESSMTIEGVTAHFKSNIGIVSNILPSRSALKTTD